jgi:hypothetical protein
VARCLKKLMWKRNKEKESNVDDVALDVKVEDEGGESGNKLGEERREKEARRKMNSEREGRADENRDGESEREKSGNSKRKREQDTFSEEQVTRRSRLQLREDPSVGDSAHTSAPIHRREQNNISARLGKRQRSRSHTRSRNDYKEDRQPSSSQHRHREDRDRTGVER